MPQSDLPFLTVAERGSLGGQSGSERLHVSSGVVCTQPVNPICFQTVLTNGEEARRQSDLRRAVGAPTDLPHELSS